VIELSKEPYYKLINLVEIDIVFILIYISKQEFLWKDALSIIQIQLE